MRSRFQIKLRAVEVFCIIILSLLFRLVFQWSTRTLKCNKTVSLLRPLVLHRTFADTIFYNIEKNTDQLKGSNDFVLRVSRAPYLGCAF